MKVGRKAKLNTSRYFVLEDRFLYYYAHVQDQRPKGVIFLEGSTVRMETAVPKGKFGFSICQKNSAKSKVLFCNSAEERDAWLVALVRATKCTSIHDFYKVDEKKIGSGKFATVHRAEPKGDDGKPVAVKIISKEGVNDESREYIRTEIAIMRLVNHPNVVRLVGLFDELDKLYLVMEWLEAGDLLRRLLRLPRRQLPERVVVKIVRCLLAGLRYLHEHCITHRDLKPENVLIDGPVLLEDATPEQLADIHSVKITDFGLSAVTGQQSMEAPLGTVAYAAPEILLNRPYDRSVDIWSLGVCTYVMLGGVLPFSGENDKAVAKAAVKGEFQFDAKHWEGKTGSAREFVTLLLKRNPAERPGAEVALEDSWLNADSQRLWNHQASLSSDIDSEHPQFVLEVAGEAPLDVPYREDRLDEFLSDLDMVKHRDLQRGLHRDLFLTGLDVKLPQTLSL